MDLPRKTDEKSVAYWRAIDEAAKRVKKISDRQASNANYSAAASKNERDSRSREERRQGS